MEYQIEMKRISLEKNKVKSNIFQVHLIQCFIYMKVMSSNTYMNHIIISQQPISNWEMIDKF